MTYGSISTVIVATLFVLLPVYTVQAQPTSVFGDVRLQARPGDALQVRHLDGRRTHGDLRMASVDDLVLEVDGRLVTIPMADVRELGTTSDSLRNGALIGLATGAVVGMMLSVSSTTSGDGLVDAATAGPVALVGLAGGAGAGVGIGIGIDALMRRYRVLYRAPVQLTPMPVSGGRYGMAFRVAW